MINKEIVVIEKEDLERLYGNLFDAIESLRTTNFDSGDDAVDELEFLLEDSLQIFQRINSSTNMSLLPRVEVARYEKRRFGGR